MIRKRTILLLSCLLVCFLALPVALALREARQERLNHALLAAVKRNDTQAAAKLLEEGADASTRDDLPRQRSIWQLLLERLQKRRPVASSAAPTLLHIALDWQRGGPGFPSPPPQNHRLIHMLLAHGADPNARDRLRTTPLILAASGEDEASVRMLLDAGANVDAQDYTGWNALNYAAVGKEAKIVQLLLDRHADVSHRDREGVTALGWAQRRHIVASICLLKQAGAKS